MEAIVKYAKQYFLSAILCTTLINISFAGMMQPTKNNDHGILETGSDLNEYGISTLLPPKNVSFAADNSIFTERIRQELGANFSIQDILNFIPNIEAYVEHLLNRHNHNQEMITIAQLAVIDIKKAKKMLRSNQVTSQEEHDMRLALRKIDIRVQSLTAKDDSFQE